MEVFTDLDTELETWLDGRVGHLFLTLVQLKYPQLPKHLNMSVQMMILLT